MPIKKAQATIRGREIQTGKCSSFDVKFAAQDHPPEFDHTGMTYLSGAVGSGETSNSMYSAFDMGEFEKRRCLREHTVEQGHATYDFSRE